MTRADEDKDDKDKCQKGQGQGKKNERNNCNATTHRGREEGNRKRPIWDSKDGLHNIVICTFLVKFIRFFF
jgi:hypothetical protein